MHGQKTHKKWSLIFM